MAFYEQFLDQTKFGSYEDYLKNFHVNVPENFNYAFDVLDKIAEAEPIASRSCGSMWTAAKRR